MFRLHQLDSDLARKEFQLETFDKFWNEYIRSKNSIQKKIDPGRQISEQEVERLRGQFEACTSSFERALKALKLNDEAKQRSEFEKLSEKLKSLTPATSFGENRKLTSLDEIEELLDEIPDPEIPELFGTATEAETELARIEIQLEQIRLIRERLRALETSPKIDEMEKLVNVQRSLKKKENRLKNVSKKFKFGAKILSDFESDFEDLDRDGRKFENVLSLGGDLAPIFLQVCHF